MAINHPLYINNKKLIQELVNEEKCIIEDAKGKRSKVWEMFGITKEVKENGEHKEIKGWVGCKQCNQVYKYNSRSGTSTLLTHKHNKNQSKQNSHMNIDKKVITQACI